MVSYEALRDIYTRDDNILFVLSEPEGDLYSREFLEAVAWLTDEAWKLPFTTRVNSVTNFQHSEAEGDDLIVGDLVIDPAGLTAEDLAKIEKIALNEPLLYNRLIGDKHHVTGINVTLTLPEKDSMEAVVAATAAKELAGNFEENFPDLDVYITGMVMLNNAFAEASIKDMSGLIPIMYGGILVITVILLRSVAGTLGTLLVIMFTTISAMGLMGWLGIPMSAPVSTAPTIILTLAVADSIHLLITFLQEMRRGRSKKDSLVESMRVNFQPVLLTSLSTIIGFLSMNFSDAPPFRHLGNVVAMGVGAAWLFSIFFLPALIAVLPVKVRVRQENESNLMDRFADSIIRRRSVFLWGSVAVVTVLALFIPRIELNDQWVDYFAPSISFRTDTDYAMENLTGIYNIEYSMGAGESSGINNPIYLQNLEKFSQWYRQQPGVMQVSTLSDTMKRLNKNLHGDDPAYYRLPDTRELAAQFLLLFEMSLPYGLDLNNLINVDKSATRFTVTVTNLPTREIRELLTQSERWMQDNLPDYMQATGASSTVMFAHISERNVKGMLGGTAMAVLLISTLLGVSLRSVRYGLISLIPNFVPAILGFGAWALLVGEIGLSLSVVTGMTLGIVVDDTVHFLSKYLRGRREHGLDAEEAVRFAFRRVGQALLVTTVILVVGFGILSFSAFRLNAWMGQLTALVILFALLADFVFLPALLITFDQKQTQTQTDTEGVQDYEKNVVTA